MSYTRQSPSPRYLELLEIYKTVHNVGFINQKIPAEKTFSGGSLTPHLIQIKKLLDETKSQSLLDYGSGKASKYQVTHVKIENEVFLHLFNFLAEPVRRNSTECRTSSHILASIWFAALQPFLFALNK